MRFLFVFLLLSATRLDAQSKWYFQAGSGPNVSFNRVSGNGNVPESQFRVLNRAGVAFDFRLGRDMGTHWGIYAGVRTGNTKVADQIVVSGPGRALGLSQITRFSPAHLHLGAEYHTDYLGGRWRLTAGGDINYVMNQYKELVSRTEFGSVPNPSLEDTAVYTQTMTFASRNSWAINFHTEAEYRLDTRHSLTFGAYWNLGLRPLLTKRFEPLNYNGIDHTIDITNRGSYLAFMVGYKRRIFNPKGSVRERVVPKKEHDPFDTTPGDELGRGGYLLAANVYAWPSSEWGRTRYAAFKAGYFYSDGWAVGPDFAYSTQTGRIGNYRATEWYAGGFLRRYLAARKNRSLNAYLEISMQRRWFRGNFQGRPIKTATWAIGLTPGLNWRVAKQLRLDASVRILNQYRPGRGVDFLSNLWPQIGINYIIR